MNCVLNKKICDISCSEWDNCSDDEKKNAVKNPDRGLLIGIEVIIWAIGLALCVMKMIFGITDIKLIEIFTTPTMALLGTMLIQLLMAYFILRCKNN